MPKNIILTALIVLFPFSAHAACEGFNNGMNALEAAIGKTAQASPAPTTYRDRNSPKGPPIAAINAQLDELEAAIKAQEAKEQAVQPQSYPHRQKPTL